MASVLLTVPCQWKHERRLHLTEISILLISLCCWRCCQWLLYQPPSQERQDQAAKPPACTWDDIRDSDEDVAMVLNHSSKWPAPQAGQGSERDLFDWNILPILFRLSNCSCPWFQLAFGIKLSQSQSSHQEVFREGWSEHGGSGATLTASRGASNWQASTAHPCVLKTVLKGYRLQLASDPPKFNSILDLVASGT